MSHKILYIDTCTLTSQNPGSKAHYLMQVGLSSPMIHSQFRLVPGGSLELVRRCTAKTCFGHCVCSTQDGRCALDDKQCHDVSKGMNNIFFISCII